MRIVDIVFLAGAAVMWGVFFCIFHTMIGNIA